MNRIFLAALVVFWVIASIWPQIARGLNDTNQTPVLFIKENLFPKNNQLYFSASSEPSANNSSLIFESQDNITNPNLVFLPTGIAAYFQTASRKKKENHLLVSVDRGKNFSAFELPPPSNPSGNLYFSRNRWYYSTQETSPNTQEIAFPPPNTPVLLEPRDGFITNNSSFEIKCRTNERTPVVCNFNVYAKNKFPRSRSWSFEQIKYPGSEETSCRIPFALQNGKYYLNAHISNGAAESALSNPIEFSIDNTPPIITLISPAQNFCLDAEIDIAGSVNKPAFLSIGGTNISLEAQRMFKSPFKLRTGNNTIIIIATDEAGNSASLIKTIFCSLPPSNISLIKPAKTDQIKPASTVFIRTTINDPFNQIENESSAVVSIAGKTLEERLYFDAAKKELEGFVNLPADIPDGKYPLIIQLEGSSDPLNRGQFTITIGNPSAEALQEFGFYGLIAAQSAVISSYGNGPNPFSPARDGNMYFTYALSSAADLKINIFDLEGALIWKKELANASTGSTPWNGINIFGRRADNGVYPYVIEASAGGKREIQRGKIVVLQ